MSDAFGPEFMGEMLSARVLEEAGVPEGETEVDAERLPVPGIGQAASAFSVTVGSNGIRLDGHFFIFARGSILATIFVLGPELVTNDSIELAGLIDQRIQRFSPLEVSAPTPTPTALVSTPASGQSRYRLEIAVEPFWSGGDVFVDPEPDPDETYSAGTEVIITASPVEHRSCGPTPYHSFVEWDGDVSGAEPALTLTMDSDKLVVALFREFFPPLCVLTPTPTATPAIRLEEVSLVTDSAAVGNFHNAWGGHQTRIVRTSNGDVYTTYLVDAAGDSPNDREFRLARKSPAGWEVIGGGAVFGEPVQLVRGPDDELTVVGWLGKGKMAMWTLAPGTEELIRSDIPGSWHEGDPAYSAVGISRQGTIYLFASDGAGGSRPDGLFQWARYVRDERRWSDLFEVTMDYRYTYGYVLPGDGGDLHVVANRDVVWSALGHDPGLDPGTYAFNAIGYWHSGDSEVEELTRTIVHEESPTEAYPAPDTFNNYKGDAYRDAAGRTHVVYLLRGATTGGEEQLWHAIIEAGEVTYNARLDVDGGRGGVLTEDSRGRLYLLTYAMDGSPEDTMAVYAAADERGTRWEAPVRIQLGGYIIRYSGVTIAAPRGGTGLADYVDGAFPAGDDNDNEWVHFRIRLR